MAGYTVELDLSIAQEFEVVRSGAVINSVTIDETPAGFDYYVRLGGNRLSGPFRGRKVWRLQGDLPNSDVREGFYVTTRAPLLNGRMVIWISFQ